MKCTSTRKFARGPVVTCTLEDNHADTWHCHQGDAWSQIMWPVESPFVDEQDILKNVDITRFRGRARVR